MLSPAVAGSNAATVLVLVECYDNQPAGTSGSTISRIRVIRMKFVQSVVKSVRPGISAPGYTAPCSLLRAPRSLLLLQHIRM